MNCTLRKRTAGFTIIELLIVMGVIGVVITAVFGLYISTRSSAHTQEEVVEVQQSLRIAADQIARDIRLAGFMLPGNAIEAATSSGITLRTSTMSGRMARVKELFLSPDSSDDTVDIVVVTADMTDFFAEDDLVRIVRPPLKNQPINSALTVVDVDREGQTIQVKGFSTPSVQYNPGDIIVRVEEETIFPETITYLLSTENVLERNGETLAMGVTNISFRYVLKDDENDAPADLGAVRAVRFTVTGISEDKGQGPKTRTVTQLATLRN
jgi:prepilin-type N-terminal cleavage/methylation domain-containing protein